MEWLMDFASLLSSKDFATLATFTHSWTDVWMLPCPHAHQEQLGLQDPAQGHFDTQPGRGGI